MTRSYTRWVLVLSFLLTACSPGRQQAPDGGGTTTPVPGSCQEGQTQCQGSTLQECSGGTFRNKITCAAGNQCDAKLGCVACLPNQKLCVGDSVHSCNADGTIGPQVQMCDANQCKEGACMDNCGQAASDLIYVVDENYDLLSFDPKKNTFSPIGSLNCPAGPSWPDWNGTGPATPFSMSVDRKARAWVLYTSGEIFWVSTTDASCQKNGFAPGQNGFELFGMGFVSDAAGSTQETLFVAGGSAATPGKGNLGSINGGTLTLSAIGPLPGTENGPELTGTGNAELYGYYPGTLSSMVAKIDKSTGKDVMEWPLQGLGNMVRAWAFAHWGGRFYIFVTTQDDLGNDVSQVQLFDPMTGKATVILPSIPYVIVGAGVSTCAPVVIG